MGIYSYQESPEHDSSFLNLWPPLQIFQWLFLYLMTLCLRKEALWYWSAVLKETLCQFTLGRGWTKRCPPEQLVSLPTLFWSLTPLSVTLEFMPAWLSMKVEFYSPVQFKPCFNHLVRHEADVFTVPRVWLVSFSSLHHIQSLLSLAVQAIKDWRG